jgi:hypothetical protein
MMWNLYVYSMNKNSELLNVKEDVTYKYNSAYEG